MKKKILTFILSICFIIPCMFVFSACSNTQPADIEFKVENGYIQYYDGETWNNLIAIADLEGEDGIGIDGREVEFKTTQYYIQWRYKTSNNNSHLPPTVSDDPVTGYGILPVSNVYAHWLLPDEWSL